VSGEPLSYLTDLYFRRQHLCGKNKAQNPVEAAASICGVNAQRGITIYLAFWNRIPNLQKKDLDRALYETRELVKTWCMRGTVHVVPSHQFQMYTKAAAPFRSWSPDISDDLCEKVVKALEEPLTKSEITEKIQSGVPEKGFRTQVARAVRLLGYKGIVVFADALGSGFYTREYKFALAENWLSHIDFSEEDPEKARQNLLKNYLRCYGPATVQDFAYWAGFKMREARRVFESIDTEEVKIRGRPYYMKAGDNLDTDAGSQTDEIILLPEYDSYVMGHKDKSRILKEEYRPQVFLPLASVAATIVRNGLVIGTWSMKKERKLLKYQINPFEKCKERDMDLIHDEMERIAQFMNMKYCINSDSH
jgi:hypothetical protein